jgi:hypothetical protein
MLLSYIMVKHKQINPRINHLNSLSKYYRNDNLYSTALQGQVIYFNKTEWN